MLRSKTTHMEIEFNLNTTTIIGGIITTETINTITYGIQIEDNTTQTIIGTDITDGDSLNNHLR